MWEVGQVSKIPWREELEGIDELETLSKEAVAHLVSKRQYDFVSPHYGGPVLLNALGVDDPLARYDHPHRELREDLDLDVPEKTVDAGASLSELGVAAAKHLERIEANLQTCADAIDEAVFDCFDITDEQRETVLQEIALRTIEDPREREEYDPEAITEPSDDFPEMVKDLLLHFTLRTVAESDDGIVPLSDVEGEPDLLDRIENEFERIFGEHATDRLAEADAVLGAESADQEAYPNLRAWLEADLFDYQVSTFDRTPILWRFTTERLVSDPDGEGFACLVDYHGIDAGLFDRLQNRHLEPRKSLLRERRSAANRQRGDDSLPASEQAAAADQHARCESGLNQITVLEDRLGELAESSPRDWPDENQRTAAEAAERVAEFRERTEGRLAAVDELATLDDVDMAALFTGNFYGKVDKQREEWLDALDDLEDAFRAYAAAADEPVPAHLYDLFDYYADDLLGSSHFASNGILYMTYYFDDFEQADQGRLNDAGISRRQRLISQLARDLDEYIELGETIAEDCRSVSSKLPAEWEDRALSEITTAGYQPNHKHGVEINITPLAEAEIVPTTVDDRVL
jgi:hypothetical protein